MVVIGIKLLSRIMLSEISTPKTQARYFSYFAFATSLGAVLGPLTGGGLIEFTKNHLARFSSFWLEYPYSLPGMVCGVVILIVTVLNSLFLDEVSRLFTRN
jgi:MFS family permease